ncbi:LL-diaminopimelate aminotransferase [Barrientosiimonas marina]|uniref:Aminotransferase n=1 Tax=Lentibacillus kimchii TaxID=1542911 RepID=A0ABW2UQC7_9BACI
MAFVSDNVMNLPPYLFSRFQEQKQLLEADGVDVIDLGIGAPDLPPPDFVIDRLTEEARNPANHGYSAYNGSQEFREAVAQFYDKHYGVQLDPDTEVLAVIGSKEGIAHVLQAALNPGDVALIPDPGYPVYRSAVHLAGGKSAALPLDSTHHYQPDYAAIDSDVLKQATLLLLNYPNNPTAAVADSDTFLKAISFARENRLLLVHDAAYDLLTFADYEAPSVMQVPGAKEQAVEFGSLSKSFNMAGWRIGYAVGNPEVIQALSALKSNLDTSQFLPVQKAAATALTSDLKAVARHNQIYQERLSVVYQGLKELGISVSKPNGTIFVWAEVPAGLTSMTFADKLLQEAGVIVTPGNAFGERGEGYFRLALTVPAARLREAVERLRELDLQEVTR